MSLSILHRALGRLLLLCAMVPVGRAAAPVEFLFTVPADVQNPYKRDLWAEVITPSHQTLRLPVFYYGDGLFAVRARATEKGRYGLGTVTEQRDASAEPATLEPRIIRASGENVMIVASLPQVTGHAGRPAQLVFSDGQPYTPIGANIAWGPPDTSQTQFYARAFREFHSEGLNWMRIWMAHWSGLNLDWASDKRGPSPPLGTFNLRVAADWDQIITGAEDAGVYVQLVLQHHGQYSSTVNPNWPANPWNAALPGGFLKTAGDFFASRQARELTEWKYRYIIARWGYSPAILAWELFNEVHWVDAYRVDHNEADVATWHAAMAQFIRQRDPYRHLVTTSTEDLRSEIYAQMDYFQPHLYSADVIAGARSFAPPPDQLDRPVFYGEMGDDHLPLSKEQKQSGVSIVPAVWASLMGRGRLPAQPWLGADLLEQGRLGELGAVARFVEATGLDRRANLTCFSAVVDSASRQPLTIPGVQRWQRRAAPEIDLPLDGRQLPEFADIPQVYSGSATARAAGYPDHATFRLEISRELNARAIVTGMANHGASIRLSIDGRAVAEKSWAAKAPDAPSATHPVELPFRIPAGHHTLAVENPAGPDWFELDRLDLGTEVAALAAVGQRSDSFIALWVWHRANIYELGQVAAAAGTLMIDDVPAGRWQVVWWDTFKGTPSAPLAIEHSGGRLFLPTPPIARHAAVVLTKM